MQKWIVKTGDTEYLDDDYCITTCQHDAKVYISLKAAKESATEQCGVVYKLVPKKIDYLSHEALERAEIAMSFVDKYLLNSKLDLTTEEVDLVDVAFDALSALYQKIGARHL